MKWYRNKSKRSSNVRRRWFNHYHYNITSQTAMVMGPTWGPPGSCRPQVDPMEAPRTLLSGIFPLAFLNIQKYYHATDTQTFTPKKDRLNSTPCRIYCHLLGIFTHGVSKRINMSRYSWCNIFGRDWKLIHGTCFRGLSQKNNLPVIITRIINEIFSARCK